MKNLLSSTGLVSLVVLILLCALCEATPYRVDPSSGWCASSTRFGQNLNRAVIIRSKNIPKQNNENNVTFFMIGMPLYNIKDYDPEVELQRLQGNYEPPSVSDNQLQNVIEQLMEPKFGLCWTLSGSISSFAKTVDTFPNLKTSPVISGLFCFNDTLTPLLINNIEDLAQRTKRDNFQWNCEDGGNKLIQESIYTEDSITTKNIANTTECYAKLPCFHCEQEVIEIRRGDKIAWNIIGWHNYPSCTREQDAIPAASVMECFQNGGRFIKSIHAPVRKLRCVSKKCKNLPKEYPIKVNSIDFKYNNCDLDYAKKEMKRQEFRDALFGDSYRSRVYGYVVPEINI